MIVTVLPLAVVMNIQLGRKVIRVNAQFVSAATKMISEMGFFRKSGFNALILVGVVYGCIVTASALKGTVTCATCAMSPSSESGHHNLHVLVAAMLLFQLLWFFLCLYPLT